MFITLEGPEGAGKSTAVSEIQRRLVSHGVHVVSTREPGEGDLGISIRKILLDGQGMVPLAELFLFLADRAQHVQTVIRPALSEGKVVLCDRYADSTIVYQGVARGLDKALLRDLNAIATQRLKPDLTLLLDVSPEIGLVRATERNRLDREPLPFHRAVRQGFLEEARLEPQRWRLIDASCTVDEVTDACWTAVAEKMGLAD